MGALFAAAYRGEKLARNNSQLCASGS